MNSGAFGLWWIEAACDPGLLAEVASDILEADSLASIHEDMGMWEWGRSVGIGTRQGVKASPLRLISGLQKDGWVFDGKKRGDRSGMDFDNPKGILQVIG